MELINALIAICLGVSFLTLSAILLIAIREHQRSRAQLEAAWVVLEAAHPDAITAPGHPSQPS